MKPAAIVARLMDMKRMATLSIKPLIIVLLFSFRLSAQVSDFSSSTIISGRVLDETGKPFPYTTVSLLNATDSTVLKGTLSTDQGNYEFKQIPEGNYLVSFYVIGYQKIVKGPYLINATKKSQDLGVTQLSQDAKQLKGVEIINKKPLIERQIDKTVINVENSAIAAGNNALDILQKSPGVSVDKDGNISLRGKQGVNVMIDGKPTYLSSEQLANLLRSTEGNALQSIELITNPSAKYDASGNSGIINLKLKKNRNYGTNGSVSGGLGYGKYYKASSGLTLNHREKKFNVFGDFNGASGKRFTTTDIVRINNTNSNKTYFDQKNYTLRKRDNINYKAGIDYFISDKHILGFTANGYANRTKNQADALTLIGDHPSVTDSTIVAVNPKRSTYSSVSLNLNYRGTLDTSGQEIGIDIDHSKYIQDENSNFNNRFFDTEGQILKPDYLFRNSTPKKTQIWAAKADYTYPIRKDIKLEVGLKSSIVKTDNNFIFENFYNNQWQNDTGRSNHFLYDENINSAYSNLSKKFKKMSVQLGLRMEQTNSKGNSVTTQKVSDRHYLNVFPSIFVNQEIGRNHEMGISYSRRIDRPNYEDLNPFMAFVDLYTYRFGNPFLKPQYTNSFEFSYAYKKTLNVSLGYSQTTDVISDVLLTDTLRKSIFISKENLSTQDFYNLNISYPLRLTKWWNSSNNFTLLYNRFSTADILGSAYKSGVTSFHLGSNHTFSIDENTSLECAGYYQAKGIYGTLIIAPQYSVDLGIRRSMLDKRMDIKIAANDIFKLQRSRITSAIPSQDYTVNETQESRVFMINCTYRFGSAEIKAARQRSGGAESEGRRVKSQ